MSRSIHSTILAASLVVLALAPRAWSQDAQDKAAAAIQEAGGKVDRDDKAPGKPITAVNFATLPIGDDKLDTLAGLDKAEKLTLNNTKVTDAGLDKVKGLASLKKLYLVDTAITDAGLEKIKGMANLEILSLAGTQVTDAGLEHVKALGNLKTLFVAGTKVSEDGAKKLKEAMPKLTIER